MYLAPVLECTCIHSQYTIQDDESQYKMMLLDNRTCSSKQIILRISRGFMIKN